MVKQGRILKGIGGFYYVEAEQTIYECKARGVFRKRGTTPLAGDWVQICIDNDTGTIEEIFPRKNMLVRPPCANIDQMFLVTSVCDPSPNLLVLDKMIAVAEDQEMEPILVISKTDLQSPHELENIYRKVGIQVIEVSSVSGQGIAQIKMLLKDKISVFTGNSGVGKSSLLNCISPEFRQETGIISSKLGRGKHTTRQVELLKLPCGGYVADTPGFSTMDMERYNIVKKEHLQYCFREMKPYITQCKFSSCSHTCEKGCAVLRAVEQGEITQSRHNSYTAMYEQVKDKKEWERK
ncbi:MAG: ribosome small subunit-dependent GTPase A [Oscillospiraceae bacterium]|nr:ribosome small subunit-dependent GTPase A [Oscillospiraceae bacterium]